MLESHLVHLVLSFERKNLIVGILTESAAIIAHFIHVFNFVDSLRNLLIKTFVDTGLSVKLLAPAIDLLTESFVLCLELVVFA